MKRNLFDLSHFSIVAGDIGRLQTLSVIPVVAGDSMAIQYDAVMRLAALRRDLTLDAQVDLMAFYIPHRQIYGENFQLFINQGVDEVITLTLGATSGTPPEEYFGHRAKAATAYPLWVVAGYNRIFTRFFRPPTDLSKIRTDAFLETTARGKKYGSLCTRLKTPWNTGVDELVADADRQVSTAGDILEIMDLEEIKRRYKTEQERDFFGQRYTDVLKMTWGGSATTEADERPHLLMRNTQMLSGYDIDGTDDANLGTFSGKAAGQMSLRVPMKYFKEHGAIWLMAVVRFPTIFEQERHYLMGKSQPTYKELAADPDIWLAEEPQQISADDWFADGASNDLGNGPYGQWYRHHPNYIHPQFDVLNGFPFSETTPTTKDTARFHVDGEFDSAFQSTQLGHWNAKARVSIAAKRVVTSAKQSIYAGT